MKSDIVSEDGIEHAEKSDGCTCKKINPFIHGIEIDLRFDIIGRAILFGLVHLGPIGKLRVDQSQKKDGSDDAEENLNWNGYVIFRIDGRWDDAGEGEEKARCRKKKEADG